MSNHTYKPGDVVADQYEIQGIVGSGGFARVYRAVERRLGRDVALKIMSSSDDSASPEPGTVYGRFVREARLVSQLDSPHTITLYDYDSLPDGRLYMVLEFVEGTTLDQMLDADEQFPPERIRRIATQMLDGLGEAHAAGVLHRDIKPSNVMLFDRRGRSDCVKLLDFGIAKKVASEDALHDDLTVQGNLVGTPRYMSPEQIQQLPLTPASDLYSLGLLIYEMWCGHSPFPTSDITEIFKRMRAFTDDIGELESAPEPLQTVGTRLLQPEPDDRYPSAEAVLDAFGHPVDETSAVPDSEESTSSEVPPSFPVGFDRAADTPSSELTGVEPARGQMTAAAERRLESASPGSKVTRSETPRDNPPTTGPAESAVEPEESPTVEDRTPRSQRSTDTGDPRPPASSTDGAEDRSSRTALRVGLAVIVVGILAAGAVALLAGNVSPTAPWANASSPSDTNDDSPAPTTATPPTDREGAPPENDRADTIARSLDRAARRIDEALTASSERADHRADSRRDSASDDERPSGPPTDAPPEDEHASEAAEHGEARRETEPTPSGEETSPRDRKSDDSSSDESEGVKIQPFE